MKWTEILRKDEYALLQNVNDTQFAVVYQYDPSAKEDNQWCAAKYFEYWKPERKCKCFYDAVEFFRARTELEYITRCRLEELATKFKDRIAEDSMEFGDSDADFIYFFENECEMWDYEMDFFGIPKGGEEDDEW